jgi:hypothetical protein
MTATVASVIANFKRHVTPIKSSPVNAGHASFDPMVPTRRSRPDAEIDASTVVFKEVDLVAGVGFEPFKTRVSNWLMARDFWP